MKDQIKQATERTRNAILKSLKDFRESYINSFKEISKKRI